MNLKKYSVSILLGAALLVLPAGNLNGFVVLPDYQSDTIQFGISPLNSDGTYHVTVDGIDYKIQNKTGPYILNLPVGCALVLVAVVVVVGGYIIYSIVKICKKIPQINTNSPPDTNFSIFKVLSSPLEKETLEFNLPTTPLHLSMNVSNITQTSVLGASIEGTIVFALESAIDLTNWQKELFFTGNLNQAVLTLNTYKTNGQLVNIKQVQAMGNTNNDVIYTSLDTNKVFGSTNSIKFFRLISLSQ